MSPGSCTSTAPAPQQTVQDSQQDSQHGQSAATPASLGLWVPVPAQDSLHRPWGVAAPAPPQQHHPVSPASLSLEREPVLEQGAGPLPRDATAPPQLPAQTGLQAGCSGQSCPAWQVHGGLQSPPLHRRHGWAEGQRAGGCAGASPPQRVPRGWFCAGGRSAWAWHKRDFPAKTDGGREHVKDH